MQVKSKAKGKNEQKRYKGYFETVEAKYEKVLCKYGAVNADQVHYSILFAILASIHGKVVGGNDCEKLLDDVIALQDYESVPDFWKKRTTV